jgi:hypothetical protein
MWVEGKRQMAGGTARVHWSDYKCAKRIINMEKAAGRDKSRAFPALIHFANE